MEPINYYGFTKLEIERILKWYGELKGLRFAALRYFNAAGYDIKGRINCIEKNPANLPQNIPNDFPYHDIFTQLLHLEPRYQNLLARH